MDYINQIEEYLNYEINTLKKLDKNKINEVINLLEDTRNKNKSIYVFGNGGSAATASHMQNDFNKGVSEHIDKKYRFHCLNDNIATIMAIANDISYDEIFRFQLNGVLDKDDLVIAISGSGNSRNILNAVDYAKNIGCRIIGITGYDGGKLGKVCTHHLNVPINSMQITEDVHMIFDHMIMSVLYKVLCNKEHISK